MDDKLKFSTGLKRDFAITSSPLRETRFSHNDSTICVRMMFVNRPAAFRIQNNVDLTCKELQNKFSVASFSTQEVLIEVS